MATTGQIVPGSTGFTQQAPAVTSTSSSWTVTLPVIFASAAFLAVLARYTVHSWTARRRCLASTYFPLEGGLAILAAATAIDITLRAKTLGVFDHLSKLSSINLVCITMHLALPSLGHIKKDRPVVLAVVSLMANLFPMMTAAFTYGWAASPATTSRFRADYMVSSAVALLVFGILVSHSLTAATVRETLQNQFKAYGAPIWYRYRTCRHDGAGCACFYWDKLRESVAVRFWTLAVMSNPDRSLRASGAPLVSAILCWGVNGVVLMARFSSLMLYSSCCRDWRKYFSSYRTSAPLLVFLLQAAGVVLGLVASFARGLNSNPFSEAAPLLDLHRAWKALLCFQTYRFARLVDWKKPLVSPPPIGARTEVVILAKLAEVGSRIRASFVDFLILIQLGLVLFVNLVLLIASATGIVSKFLPLSCRLDGDLGIAHIDAWQSRNQQLGGYEESLRKGYNKDSTRSQHDRKKAYERRKPFVLFLGRAKIDGSPLLGRWANLPENWIRKGRLTKPAKLCELLEKSSKGFAGALDLQDKVETIDRRVWSGLKDLKYAPICQTLIIAILARVIHVKFLKSRRSEALYLVEQARESILYTRFVEKQLLPSEVKNSIHAADMVMGEMGDDDEPQDTDTDYSRFLRELIDEDGTSEEELMRILDGLTSDDALSPSERTRWALVYRWSYVMFSAYPSLHTTPTGGLNGEQFERARKVLADFIGFCLMDLPKAIVNLCYYAPYGEKEEEVYRAAILLGEVEDVLQKLRDKWGIQPRHKVR